MSKTKETAASKLKKHIIEDICEREDIMPVETGVPYYDRKCEHIILPCEFSDDLRTVRCIRCTPGDGYAFDLDTEDMSSMTINDSVNIKIDDLVMMVPEDSDVYSLFWAAFESALKITHSRFNTKTKRIIKNEKKKDYTAPETKIKNNREDQIKASVKIVSDAFGQGTTAHTLAVLDFGDKYDKKEVLEIVNRFMKYLKNFY